MKHNSDFSCKVNVIFSTISEVLQKLEPLLWKYYATYERCLSMASVIHPEKSNI